MMKWEAGTFQKPGGKYKSKLAMNSWGTSKKKKLGKKKRKAGNCIPTEILQ